jgi:pimeloyl-ACP methyl ester carboxylesterase
VNYIISNGIRIAYQERGQGEPLVLIMGLGADGARWEDHVKAFEKHFRCILVDNRGAGASDQPPGPYTTLMMAEDIAGLMDALGIPQARLAGISMGAGIALQLAIQYPTKVRSLGLISGWARCDSYMVNVFEHFKRLRAFSTPADFMQLLQLWIFTSPYFETHAADLLQGRQDAATNPMPQAAFDAQCDACITHNVIDRLHEVQAPALVTVGKGDIFTPLWCAEEIQGGLPNGQLWVLEGAGHAHHWEKLEEFNRRMTAFLLEN